MFKTIYTATAGGLSINTTIIGILTALALGMVMSIVYMLSDKEKKYSSNFAISLVILPPIVAVVILLIGSDIAKALSIGGVFALVRFRSVPGDSKDISYVFFAMSIGLATGMGYLTLAVVFTVLVSVAFIVLMRSGYARSKVVCKTLKITIPENLNYQGTFDDLFNEFATDVSLESVKTTNMGTLYQLEYRIFMKKEANEKQFMDAIRCRNGNLDIILCRSLDNNNLL